MNDMDQHRVRNLLPAVRAEIDEALETMNPVEVMARMAVSNIWFAGAQIFGAAWWTFTDGVMRTISAESQKAREAGASGVALNDLWAPVEALARDLLALENLEAAALARLLVEPLMLMDDYDSLAKIREDFTAG